VRPFPTTCVLLLCCRTVAAQASPGFPADVSARIVQAVERHMREARIPGLSIAIGDRGQVVWARGFGQADLEGGIAVTPATLFRLQSTQKLLTATAVLRLAELGRLGLDDPVQRHCPAFGVTPWPVTLRDLLSHQGGIRASTLADLFNREHYASPEAAVRRFARDSMAVAPGARVVYSNAGYTLLACAIVGATGQPYDSALAALVLRPSAMTTARDDNVYEVIPGRARYYVVRTATNTEQWRGLWTDAHLHSTRLDQPSNADPVDPSWAIGAGSYLGTPGDLARFALALTGGRLLLGTYRDSAFAAVPLRATGEPTARALGGWVLDPEGGDVARLLGSTWNGSFGVGVDPSRGIAVAIASNIEFDQPAELVKEVIALLSEPRVGPP
jgi:CubicO group peptidase (beta-lactamase class C family)